MNCFIAMAFDRDDTDKLYDEVLEPVLKELGIKPIRIDRVEHNDDIDDRIIQSIKYCTFCLADLTYARPSVYFEAGFAQREVPVVYTCRTDHFTAKSHADDPDGTRRVHFDLSMKNIVGWKHPADATFRTRLASRIRYVIHPIKSQQRRTKELADRKAAFVELSVHQRLKESTAAASATLQNLGYTECNVTRSPVLGLTGGGTHSYFVKRKSCHAVESVVLWIVASATAVQIEKFWDALDHFWPIPTNAFKRPPRLLTERIVLCSLGHQRLQAIEKRLVHCARSASAVGFERESVRTLPPSRLYRNGDLVFTTLRGVAIMCKDNRFIERYRYNEEGNLQPDDWSNASVISGKLIQIPTTRSLHIIDNFLDQGDLSQKIKSMYDTV